MWGELMRVEGLECLRLSFGFGAFIADTGHKGGLFTCRCPLSSPEVYGKRASVSDDKCRVPGT